MNVLNVISIDKKETTKKSIFSLVSCTKKPEAIQSFILGEGLALFPSSAIKKIQALEFVDFDELMPDNRELVR